MRRAVELLGAVQNINQIKGWILAFALSSILAACRPGCGCQCISGHTTWGKSYLPDLRTIALARRRARPVSRLTFLSTLGDEGVEPVQDTPLGLARLEGVRFEPDEKPMFNVGREHRKMCCGAAYRIVYWLQQVRPMSGL